MHILPQLDDLALTPLAGSIDDLLLAVFDAGVSAGMGYPISAHATPAIDALIETVRARWFGEMAARPAPSAAPPVYPDWLTTHIEEHHA